MKLEFDRSAFLKAWQVAEKYTPSKTTMDALNGIRITAGESGLVTLEATNLKESVKCPATKTTVLEPGQAVLNASIVGNMLRKSSAKSITLEVSSDKGTIIAGKSRSKFAVIAADTFPNLPERSGADEICTIMAADLSRLITEGSSAASAPSDFPKYLGTCMLRTQDGRLLSVSTDGKRLARSQMLCSVSKNDDVVLSASALKDLAKIFTGRENVRLFADGTLAWFVLEKPQDEAEGAETPAETPDASAETPAEPAPEAPAENTEAAPEEAPAENTDSGEAKPAQTKPQEFLLDGAEFSIRRVETNFPKYERILNNELRTKIKITKSALAGAVDRIDVIARNNTAHAMAITIKPMNEMRITARAPELGTASEELEAAVDGSPIQIGFNVSYFLDGLKAVNSEEVIIEFSEEEGQTRMYKDEGDDFLYMLMPIRLTDQDIVDEPEEPVQEDQPAQPEESLPSPEEHTEDSPF